MSVPRKHIMSLKRKGLIDLLLKAFCVCLILTAAARVQAADEAPIFSYGEGPYELIIFTDYFCQPCQRVEGGLGKALEDLITGGGVKITMVDLPLYKLTPLYARYFLYAVHASSSYKDALRARQLLFEKSSRLGAVTAEHLERDFASAGIATKPYDINPSLARYRELIGKYDVRSTPTFVFVYSPADIRKYSGSEPVKKGMAELAGALEKNLKTQK